MDKFDIPYSKVKHGRRYFQPTTELKALGFEARPLGPEGPEARSEAWRLYESWKKAKLLGTTSNEKVYPMRCMGWAFERYRRTDAWKMKSRATRQKGWEPMWRIIEPIFGDVDPRTVQIEALEELYAIVLAKHGKHDAHRLIKIWRAFWKVMAAMGLCERESDPSMIIRNTAPKGRSETWVPGEIARIAKRAWREHFYGLAALLSFCWDTQFSPNDCREITARERLQDARGVFFDTSRGTRQARQSLVRCHRVLCASWTPTWRRLALNSTMTLSSSGTGRASHTPPTHSVMTSVTSGISCFPETNGYLATFAAPAPWKPWPAMSNQVR